MENSMQWPFDVYQGGRFISAISRNKKLTTSEKMILLTIGNELDFRDIQGSQRYISNERLAEYTSMSERSVMRLTKKLCVDGYLVKTDRFDEHNRQQSSLYSLSPKVFIEYANLPEGDTISPMRVIPCRANLPYKELPQKEKNSISKDIELKKSNTSEHECSEVPQLPFIDIFEDEEPIEQKSKPKASNRKAKPRKVTRQPVTQSHQKIARIYIPDAKYVKKTYYDKGAMFFLIDEFLAEHGDKGHEAIDNIYQFCKQNDKFGRIPFQLSHIETVLKKALIELNYNEKEE